MFNPNEHMMQLKGKDYLQVAWRLVWFREDHPDWCLDAQCLEHDEDHAIFKAVILDENGIQKSSGHGSEAKRDFGDFLEKAETKAIGRALAMLGYGTQFAADELDEGERIVDSPINRQPTDNPRDKPADELDEGERIVDSPINRQPTDNLRDKPATPDQIARILAAADPTQKGAMFAKYGDKLEKLSEYGALRVMHKLGVA